MFESVTYSPEERVEVQHSLRQVPPSSQISHKELKAALERYEKARAEELTRRQDFNQAEMELPASQFKDEQKLAASKLAKRPDPGPVEETKHLELIRECRRQAGAARILLGQAVENVVAAGEKHGPAWTESLAVERDQLRSVSGELLDGFERTWHLMQVNASCRAIARGSGAQSPEFFADSFKVPRVRDGDVIQVSDVLQCLRGLSAPVEPKEDKPVQHRPLSAAPFASAGSSSQSLGARRDPEIVKAWVEKDAAEAAQRGAGLSEERRAERLARADSRKAEREAVLDAVTSELQEA